MSRMMGVIRKLIRLRLRAKSKKRYSDRISDHYFYHTYTVEWEELARLRILVDSSWTKSFDTSSEITKKITKITNSRNFRGWLCEIHLRI